MNIFYPLPRTSVASRRLPIVLTLLVVLAMLLSSRPPSALTTLAKADAATQARVSETYSNLPLGFEANQGQIDSQVKFLSRGSGYTLFLTSTEAMLVLRKPAIPKTWHKTDLASVTADAVDTQTTAPTVLRMKLVGANLQPRVAGLEELPGMVNYFIGSDPTKWYTKVPTYAKVKYQDAYPGVDLVYYGDQRQLKYDFIIAPGADPSRIRWRYDGAASVHVDEVTGNLLIMLPSPDVGRGAWGESRRPQRSPLQPIATGEEAGGEALTFTENAPIAWQTINSQRVPVAARYTIADDGSISFALGDYDPAHPLTLDPTLIYSTYLGGSSVDGGYSIAVDARRNVYVTGYTYSTDFPTTPGAFDTTCGTNGNCNYDGVYTYTDVFVAKLNAAGNALVYATYLGGSGDEFGNGIAVDDSGNAYMTGSTSSTNFPTVRPIQATYGGGGGQVQGGDAFVTKLNPTGSALVYSTYLGGSDEDVGYGIAVDPSGSAYVTGFTGSNNFPTASPIQASYGGGYLDAFVTKLNAAGSALVYSTYLGGSGGDLGNGIAVDASGNAYVTGGTSSTDFPTVSPFQAIRGDTIYEDAFVTKLNAAGSALVYSTYLGGDKGDRGYSIAVDASSNAYVTGYTNSNNFPTASPIQASYGGGSLDAFVTKLNAAGSALVYSTYLGGSGYDFGHSIAVDVFDNAYMTGYTYSADFPTANPLQATYGGGMCERGHYDAPCDDAFVTKLNPTGSVLVYSTYLGGSRDDRGYGIAVDACGNAYVTGYTESTDFPTANPLQPVLRGADAFVAKISTAWRVSASTDDAREYANGDYNDSSDRVLLVGCLT